MRGLVALSAAFCLATLPTRVTSHDAACGFPFTWYSRVEAISSPSPAITERNPEWLLLNLGLILVVFFGLGFFLKRIFKSTP